MNEPRFVEKRIRHASGRASLALLAGLLALVLAGVALALALVLAVRFEAEILERSDAQQAGRSGMEAPLALPRHMAKRWRI